MKSEKIKFTNSQGLELAARLEFSESESPKGYAAEYLRRNYQGPAILISHSLDGADHLLSKKEDSIYTGQMIATWSSRYLSHPINLTHKNL